jgi:hypothetical protein
MTTRKAQGYKYKLDEPVQWTLRLDRRVVFHRVDCLGTVETPDGPMLAVKIAHRADLANPKTDIAALVGRVVMLRKSGVNDPQSPELWYWNERFWVKARATDGTAYYNNKFYLFYQVTVCEQERLLAEITTGFDRPQ